MNQLAGIYTAEQRLIRLADRVNDAAEEIRASQRDVERAWERYDLVRAAYDQARRNLGLPPEEED